MENDQAAAAAGRYRDMIYRVALHWCGTTHDAEDVAQDVLLKLYTTRRSFDGEEHLRNWLLRVTLNTCKNHLRAPWRSRHLPLEAAADRPVFDDPAQTELYNAVMALPQQLRVPLYLFYYEDLTTRQIAALLQISQTAVTTRLSRARQQLKEALKEE